MFMWPKNLIDLCLCFQENQINVFTGLARSDQFSTEAQSPIYLPKQANSICVAQSAWQEEQRLPGHKAYDPSPISQ